MFLRGISGTVICSEEPVKEQFLFFTRHLSSMSLEQLNTVNYMESMLKVRDLYWSLAHFNKSE